MNPSDGVAFFNECFNSYMRLKQSSTSESEAKVEFLIWFQSRLMRSRRYRRVLGLVDRRILNLTIDLAKKGLVKVISRALLNVLGSILMKACSFAKRFTDLLADFGEPILLDVCRVAASWGNPDAVKWLLDKGFAAYLALLKRSIPSFLTGVR
ncbi:MAG: hypothetical protein QXW32_07100 [Nitrososphaerales archaeon]